MSKRPCFYSKCSKESKKYCGGCKEVRYCSVECQRADWPSHRLLCQKDKNKDLLDEFNLSHALYLVAFACYDNNYSIESFRGARIILNNNLLAQPNYEKNLWENSSIRLMFEEGLDDMIKECQEGGCKGMDFDRTDPSSFLFIVLYNGGARAFKDRRERIQRILDQINDFSTKNEKII